MKIAGNVALVSGAGGGLGRVWVAELLAAGAARVYAGTRDPAAFGPADPRVTPITLDVTDADSVRDAAQRCADATLIVHNAGVMRHRTFLAEDAPEAAGEDVYPGAEAQGLLAALRADEVALEQQMVATLTRVWPQDGKDGQE